MDLVEVTDLLKEEQELTNEKLDGILEAFKDMFAQQARDKLDFYELMSELKKDKDKPTTETPSKDDDEQKKTKSSLSKLFAGLGLAALIYEGIRDSLNLPSIANVMKATFEKVGDTIVNAAKDLDNVKIDPNLLPGDDGKGVTVLGAATGAGAALVGAKAVTTGFGLMKDQYVANRAVDRAMDKRGFPKSTPPAGTVQSGPPRAIKPQEVELKGRDAYDKNGKLLTGSAKEARQVARARQMNDANTKAYQADQQEAQDAKNRDSAKAKKSKVPKIKAGGPLAIVASLAVDPALELAREKLDIKEGTAGDVALGATSAAVTGAALGATVGSVVPIVGNLAGALIGGGLGAIYGAANELGAFNKDTPDLSVATSERLQQGEMLTEAEENNGEVTANTYVDQSVTNNYNGSTNTSMLVNDAGTFNSTDNSLKGGIG